MKLIFGLGNKEPDYSFTRHNIGKDFLNAFVSEKYSNLLWNDDSSLKGSFIKVDKGFMLIKPNVDMNLSGEVVAKFINYYKVSLDDVLVICDDLDQAIGQYKLAYAKGSKIHNGIISIVESLKTDKFYRLRVGVRAEEIPMSVQKFGLNPATYVLSHFTSSEKLIIENLISNKLISELYIWISSKPTI